MSLINDMLQDIEQRRERGKQQEPVLTPAAKQSSRPSVTSIAAVLVLLIITLLIGGWVYYLPKDANTLFSVEETGADGTLALVLPEMVIAEAGVSKPVPLPVANPLLISVNVAEDARQLQIELKFDLLPTRAEIRSLPKEGRVLIRLPETHLQQGLVLPQPENEHISSISLMPTSAGLDLIITVVAGQQIATSQRIEPVNSKLYIGLEFPLVENSSVELAADPIDKDAQPAVAVSPATAAKEADVAPVSAPPAPALIRTRPLPESGEQLYQRGLQQLRLGNMRGARDSLSAALHIYPEHLTARLELVGVLQQLADEQGMLRVIREGLQLQPAQPELRKLFAYNLLHQHQHQEALLQLEAAPVPGIAVDPDYHALRAAIYQELGEYSQAAQLYAQLLEQRPRESLWWMGLAIALDQQGLSGGARDAYRTALDVSGLRPDLENFVRDRLQHL